MQAALFGEILPIFANFVQNIATEKNAIDLLSSGLKFCSTLPKMISKCPQQKYYESCITMYYYILNLISSNIFSDCLSTNLSLRSDFLNIILRLIKILEMISVSFLVLFAMSERSITQIYMLRKIYQTKVEGSNLVY